MCRMILVLVLVLAASFGLMAVYIMAERHDEKQ